MGQSEKSMAQEPVESRYVRARLPVHSRRRITRLACASVLLLGTAGCSITQLTHAELDDPPTLQSGIVNVDEKASGFSGGRVGWGRLSVFAIPVAPIKIESDEASDLMQVVATALTTAGYTVESEESTARSPLVRAQVNKISFNNYTWLVPLVPTWGKINVTLSLEAPDGTVLWTADVEGSGSTLNFTDGYNVAATKSVTRLANSMVVAFGDGAFAAAVSAHQTAADAASTAGNTPSRAQGGP